MKPLPPNRVIQFLRWFCREDFIEEIEGDLTEIFEKQYGESPRMARFRFAFNVIRYFRPSFMKSFRSYGNPNPIAMFRHNILITYRNFLRYKSSFFINLTGLSTGLASALLIYLWVYDEMAVNKFHEKGERLFQVLRNLPGPSGLETHESNSTLLPAALEAEMPEVEHALPVRPAPAGIVSAGKENVKATGMFAGKDFFNVFSYEVVSGNKEKLLNEKYAMVISDQLAIKLFGSFENSLGKTIVWDLNRFGGTHIVTGIFKSPGPNSSEKFDFLVTYEAFLERSRMDHTWDSNPIYTYLTLKPGVSSEEFRNKLTDFYRQKRDPDWKGSMFVQRYTDRYLYGNFENGDQAGGRISYVILFSTIAIFILIIACINFMNLSTARASRRLKEIGIKKTVGVTRRALILQHMGESTIMVFLALITAGCLVWLFLPQFNIIAGKELTLRQDWNFIGGTLVIVLLTGLVSGSYPAFYLSGFRPVEVLKGKLNTSIAELWTRQGLVIFQFSISILLIVAVGIVYMQMDFIHTKNLGYTRENVLTFERQGKLNESLETFLAEVKDIPGVLGASSSSELVTSINSTSSGHKWEGQLPDTEELRFSGVNVNYDFIETLGIEVKQGRAFSKDFADDEKNVILNEAAVEAMGITDPVGKWIQLFGVQREITGVVKNFHFQSMYEEIQPIFMLCHPKHTNNAIVKIESVSARETMSRLEDVYHSYNPGIPFETKFLDDAYQSLYTSELKVAALSKYFAVIAIVISCLGLFGLAAFTAERRVKEIGIRKILGAGEFGIMRMLSGDFTRMVLAAIAIALPVSYFLARYWLQNFAYRIDPQWWFFAGAGFMALLIAWLTIGIQTIKAARINPVQCLRSE